MTDRYDDTLILGYLEGDLSDADRARLEERMAADATLAQLVERLREDRAALRRLPTAEPPMGLTDAAMSLEERSMLLGDPDIAAPTPSDGRHEADRRFRLRRTVGYLAMAAIVTICAGVMIVSLSDPWLESGSNWLGDRGLAMLGLDEDQTPTARSDQRDAMASETQAVPASEDLLSDMLTERLVAKREDDGKARLVGADEPRSEAAELVELADETSAEPAAEPAAAPSGGTLAMAEQDDTSAGFARSQFRGRESNGRAPATALARKEMATLQGVMPGQAKAQAAAAAPPAMEAAEPTPFPSRTMFVDVDTDDTETTRRDVMDWAVSNAVTIETRPVAARRSEAHRAAGSAGPGPGAGPGADRDGESLVAGLEAEQLTVVLDERQVPALLARLNERSGQRANIVAAPDLAPGLIAKGKLDLVSEESMRDTDLSDGRKPPATHVARMPLPPASTAESAEGATPAEAPADPPPAVWREGGFAFGPVLEQQLPLVRSTPLALFAADTSTRVELRINRIETASETDTD